MSEITSSNMPVIPCGVAIIRRGRDILIAQRKPEDTFGSYWEFPGGKKRLEESLEECTAREVREELGVEIKVDRKFSEIQKVYHERLIWLHFFLCDYVSGDPCAIDCNDFAWVDVDKLYDYTFPPANETVIDALKRLYS